MVAWRPFLHGSLPCSSRSGCAGCNASEVFPFAQKNCSFSLSICTTKIIHLDCSKIYLIKNYLRGAHRDRVVCVLVGVSACAFGERCVCVVFYKKKFI